LAGAISRLAPGSKLGLQLFERLGFEVRQHRGKCSLEQGRRQNDT
jgi:hypothetical protein